MSADKVHYNIKVKVDSRIVEMDVVQETNYEGGEPAQLATLFMRAMLANGYSPATTVDAFGRLAESFGYKPCRDGISAVLSNLKDVCGVD